jgi:hypothetical protein
MWPACEKPLLERTFGEAINCSTTWLVSLLASIITSFEKVITGPGSATLGDWLIVAPLSGLVACLTGLVGYQAGTMLLTVGDTLEESVREAIRKQRGMTAADRQAIRRDFASGPPLEGNSPPGYFSIIRRSDATKPEAADQ